MGIFIVFNFCHKTKQLIWKKRVLSSNIPGTGFSIFSRKKLKMPISKLVTPRITRPFPLLLLQVAVKYGPDLVIFATFIVPRV